MVQTVYSQGNTPTHSPVHAGSNIPANGTNCVLGNGASNGGIDNTISSNIISCVNAGNGCSGVGASGMSSASNQVVKRKRSVNPQGDENFIRALEAVRSGGIGFCKAARLYGVNNRTLWLEYKKRGYPVSRPSIKSRVVKQEPNLSPSPTPPIHVAIGDDTTNENYDQMATTAAVAAAQTAAANMQMPPASETATSSLMCASHHSSSAASAAASSHPAMGVMSFIDTRHMDIPALHNMTRPRYIDATGAGSAGGNTSGATGTINVNTPAAMNLQSINFSSM